MEQDTNTKKLTEDSKQDSGNGLKIVTAIACIVAVCGVGVGVFGMIQSSQKDEQISDLKVQIEDSNGKVTTLETGKIETSDGDGTTVTIADTAVDSYQVFSDNMAKNNETSIFGYYYHYTGSDNVKKTVMARIDNARLTVTDDDLSVIAEADGIISAYFVEIGNGGVPYFYFIKKDGNVARMDVSENGKRTIEDLNGYQRIVSIFQGGDLRVHLVDIDGNIYKND